MDFDLVVRNADVATASDRFRCDIGVSEGRVVALGTLRRGGL
jgi:dihydropyrimidinase